MPRPEQYGVLGLRTDQNPAGEPQGALSIAEECVCRRRGMIEPRPGFKDGSDTDLTDIFKMLPHTNDVIVVGEESEVASTVWQRFGGGATPILTHPEGTDPGNDPLTWDLPEHIRSQEARGSIYLTTSDAVRWVKPPVAPGTDTFARRAGAPRVFCSVLLAEVDGDAERNWLLDGFQSSWCVVLRREKTEQGLIVFGAPSGSCVYQNDSGTDQMVNISVGFGNQDVQAGDVVELYRLETQIANADALSSDFFLDQERVITSANVTAGSVTLESIKLDADLGKALYTNDDQEGIARANIRPPLARDLALYQGSLFAAHITYPATLELSAIEGGNDLDATDTTRVGQRNPLGTRTASSANITGVTPFDYLKVGMLIVNRTGWSGTAPVRVTALVDTGVDTGTVTVNATWGGATDGAPTAIALTDSIRVSDGTNDLYYSATLVGSIPSRVAGSQDPHPSVAGFSIGVSQVVNDAGHVYGSRRTFVLEARLPSIASFEVWATHGAAYDPPLPEPTEADGVTVEPDVVPNGIAWSKQEEPEHFLLGQRWLVGEQQSAFQRAIVASDRLWCLKREGDGVYQLSGFGERSGWRVDPVRKDVHILHPDLAVAHKGELIAWTNLGAITMRDESVKQISAPAIHNLTKHIERLLLPADGAFPYSFAVSNHKENEVVFGLPFLAGFTAQAHVRNTFVVNLDTGCITKWFTSDEDIDLLQCGAYDPYLDGGLIFASDGSGLPRTERSASETAIDELEEDPAALLNVDREFTISIAAVDEDALTLELDDLTPLDDILYEPQVGDCLTQGNRYAMLVEEVSAGVWSVAIPADQDIADWSVASCKFYIAYQSRVQWLPHVGTGGSTRKLYKDAIVHWDDTRNLYSWTMQFAGTATPATTLSRSYTRDLQVTAQVRSDTRALLDRTIALNAQLYTTLVIRNGNAKWRVAGLAIGFEQVNAAVWR